MPPDGANFSYYCFDNSVELQESIQYQFIVKLAYASEKSLIKEELIERAYSSGCEILRVIGVRRS